MISPMDSSFLRGLLRVYFVLAFILLGIIGSQATKCTVKVALQRGKAVKLNKMTGWISGPSLIKAIFQLRRLPGGFIFGIIMIVASITTLVADFATSTLVYQKTVYDRCHFDFGLVLNASVKWWDVPPPNSAAAIVASNAQILSELNGGYVGIYNKASYAVDFSAEEKDLMGWWTCTEEVGKDRAYKSLPATDGFDDPEIAVELFKLGLQWENAWMVRDLHDSLGSAHLIIWSANIADDVRAPFEVKVSVDQGTTYGQDKQMKSYHCAVDQNSYRLNEVNEILSSMWANTTMKEWVMGLPASIYNGLNSGPNTENTTSLLAQTLNTLTMVQGGYASIMQTPALQDDQTYGCVATKTYISIVVIALAGAVGFMLLSMLFFWILQACRLGAHALPWRTNKTRKTALTPVPHDLVGWMLQASRESSMGNQERSLGKVNIDAGVPDDGHNTRQWRYVVMEDREAGGREYARLVREGGRHAVPMGVVEQVPTPMYDTSYPPPPNGQRQGVMWDPKSQGKYGLVPTHGA